MSQRIKRLKNKAYKPLTSLRVYILKSNGKMRPLGIASYEDKIVQLAVKKILESKSDLLFKDLGTDTTSAIRMFLTQAVASNGFPFEIKRNVAAQNPYRALSENELMMKLENSRKHALEGKVKDADDVISDMREKYGL